MVGAFLSAGSTDNLRPELVLEAFKKQTGTEILAATLTPDYTSPHLPVFWQALSRLVTKSPSAIKLIF